MSFCVAAAAGVQAFSFISRLSSMSEDDVSMSRLKAVPIDYSPDLFLDDGLEKSIRPMPMYSVPGLVDHF